jgi:hypothetical protein
VESARRPNFDWRIGEPLKTYQHSLAGKESAPVTSLRAEVVSDHMSGGDTRPRWASASRPSGLSIASRVTLASITIIWDAPSMQRPLPVKERDPVRHRLARKCPSPRGRSGQAVVLTDES